MTHTLVSFLSALAALALTTPAFAQIPPSPGPGPIGGGTCATGKLFFDGGCHGDTWIASHLSSPADFLTAAGSHRMVGDPGIVVLERSGAQGLRLLALSPGSLAGTIFGADRNGYPIRYAASFGLSEPADAMSELATEASVPNLLAGPAAWSKVTWWDDGSVTTCNDDGCFTMYVYSHGESPSCPAHATSVIARTKLECVVQLGGAAAPVLGPGGMAGNVELTFDAGPVGVTASNDKTGYYYINDICDTVAAAVEEEYQADLVAACEEATLADPPIDIDPPALPDPPTKIEGPFPGDEECPYGIYIEYVEMPTTYDPETDTCSDCTVEVQQYCSGVIMPDGECAECDDPVSKSEVCVSWDAEGMPCW